MSDAFVVDREVIVRARRSAVFRYFTDSERFAAWWGAGSSIDPRPGGRVEIRYPNGATAGGEVIAIERDVFIAFSYGYDDPAKPIARGASRVEITLKDGRRGTRVKLVHRVNDAATRDDHEPGWRFQLSAFANVASREVAQEVGATIDRWFDVWHEPNAARRATELEAIAVPELAFRDAFATLASRADLVAHIAASQLHMPGLALVREGEPAFCQDTALVDWSARGADGATTRRGTNVFELDADGRILSVVGFWRP